MRWVDCHSRQKQAPVCSHLGNAPLLVSRTAAMRHREGRCPAVMASYALIVGPSGSLQSSQPSEAIITLVGLSFDAAVLKTVYRLWPRQRAILLSCCPERSWQQSVLAECLASQHHSFWVSHTKMIDNCFLDMLLKALKRQMVVNAVD